MSTMPKPSAKAKATKRKDPTPLAAADLYCLLTGFGPFGSAKSNPSELVTLSFPDIFKTGDAKTDASSKKGPVAKQIHISKLSLDTVGATAWKTLKKSLKKLEKDLEEAGKAGPVIVLMTGLASGSRALHLERFGMNLRDYRIADQAGAQVEDEPVQAEGPDLLRTSLKLTAVKKSLIAAGYPCQISNHAGTFVCNELYYQVLYHLSRHKAVKACLFVHMPELKDFAEATAALKRKQTARQAAAARTETARLALLRDAMLKLLEEVAKQVH